MKKTFFALGLTVTALAFLPGSVSAHQVDPEVAAHDGYNESDDSWNDEADNQARCERIGYKLDRLNAKFDQENDRRLERAQRLIDRQSELGCAPAGTIVETLVDNGNFTTLVSAVTAAGLADDLSAPGDKTVFAPTDQAFAALPEGTVEALLNDIPTLTTILANHVVAGKVDAEAAKELSEAPALSGQNLEISVRNCDLYVNDSKVVLSDIHTTNGVIHVIDAVLVPKQ